MDSQTERVWKRLALVKSLSFTARSDASEATGWVGEAAGRVEVRLEADDCILFVEAGSWQSPEGKSINFSNTFRWTRDGDHIQLEHLRFGSDRPVYLFDLVPDGDHRMSSREPHVCSEDLYSATLNLEEEIELRWTVVGPKKKETIEYVYRTGTNESCG